VSQTSRRNRGKSKQRELRRKKQRRRVFDTRLLEGHNMPSGLPSLAPQAPAASDLVADSRRRRTTKQRRSAEQRALQIRQRKQHDAVYQILVGRVIRLKEP
jgi:hypothetical protein